MGIRQSLGSIDSTLAAIDRAGTMGIVKTSQRESSCCHEGAHRDGLIVCSFTPAAIDMVRKEGSETGEITIPVYAVNGHDGGVSLILMDVESLESHVNNCTEVLAFVRRRNEEMAAAAAGGVR